MTYGYDVIANGATLAMPSFLIYFGAFDSAGNLFIPSIWTSLWVAMTNLGQAVGSFAGGPLAHRFGRRYVIMAFSIVSIVGVSLQFTATTRGILLGGKIINGFAVGGLLAVGTTYASEVRIFKDHRTTGSFFLTR
jgi:MFS family permease